MDTKGNVLVMGGRKIHYELIKKLNARGYHTVLIDYLDNPMAKSVAHEHVQESILDTEKVLAIAKQYRPKFIANLGVDRAVVPCAFICEKLGLPNFVGYEQSIRVTDKTVMKRVFKENGIKTSPFYVVGSIGEVHDLHLNFPVVVKPADASGSIGVQKVASEDALVESLPKIFEISRTGKVVVEEFCDDLEVSIDCFVQNDKIDVLLVRQKLKRWLAEGLAYPTGSIILSEYPCHSEENIKAMARKIVDVFGLRNTPFFLQAFIDRKGELSMIEFGVRIGGGMSYQIIKSTTGFDIMDAALDCYEGKLAKISYSKPSSVYSTNYMFTRPGVFDRIVGYEDLVAERVIDKFSVLATKGHVSDGVITSRNKTGYFFIHASNVAALFEKCKNIVGRLDILDCDGHSIFNRDIFDETFKTALPYYLEQR